MATVKTKKSSGKKKIYNPVTKSYYSVRVRSTKSGKKGSIIGKWATIKKRRK